MQKNKAKITLGVVDLEGIKHHILQLPRTETAPVIDELAQHGYCDDGVHPFTRIHFNHCEPEMRQVLRSHGCSLTLGFAVLDKTNILAIYDQGQWTHDKLEKHLTSQS